MTIDAFIKNAEKTVKKQNQTKEIDIESEFVKNAKKLKCNPLKLVMLRKRGFPDRTVLCPGGRVLFIEFKRKGKKQTQPQILIMRLLKSFGFEYHICDKLGQAEEHLERFLNDN